MSRASAATTTSATAHSESIEQVAEDVEDIVDVVEAAATSTGRSLHALMSEAVVASTLLVVADNFVGLGRFLELVDGLLVTLIPVGVILQCQLLVGLLDLFATCVARDSQHFVIVAFGRHHGFLSQATELCAEVISTGRFSSVASWKTTGRRLAWRVTGRLEKSFYEP